MATFSDGGDNFYGSYTVLGSNFTWSGTKTLNAADPEGSTVVETAIKSKVDTKSNPKVDVDNIDFIINLKKGLTFTPTEISFRATRYGTDGGKIDVLWLNSDGTTKSLASAVTPNRDNGNDANKKPTGYKYTDYNFPISGEETNGACGIRLFVYNINGKTYGFCDIVIKGTITGTAIEETMYTIETAVSPEGAGIIDQNPVGAMLAEGTGVEFSATANTGYKFLDKWTVNGVEYPGETYSIASLADNTTVTAHFEKLPVLTFAKPEGVTCVNRAFPANVNTIDVGGTYTLPYNYMYYKEGYTMTGWTDGTTEYSCGDTYTIAGDATLTPLFRENTKSLTAHAGDVSVVYDFDQSTNNGRVVNIEGNEDIFITTANVDGEDIDVTLNVNCTDDAGVEGRRGKLNNTNGSRAQMNVGTVFTIPVEEGSTITIKSDRIKFSSTTFNGEPGTYNDSEYTASYTAGTAGNVEVIAQESNMYIKSITVTYPAIPTKAATPSVGIHRFDFAGKTYPVTITAAEGEKLFVAVDGGEPAEMVSPAKVNANSSIVAYATADGLDNSETVTKALPAYNSAKPYVAWVYAPTYASIQEGFADDKILCAMQEEYNVVLTEYADTEAPSDTLGSADLIVSTESMNGNGNLAKGMNEFVGKIPMINMKMFSYNSGRWEWGTGKNPGKEVVGFTPTSTLYVLFDGVTPEADGTINLYDFNLTDKNHIQTADFTSAPAGNVILGKASDGYAAVHCLDKFFGIGLSSDSWKDYNDNAAIVVCNAARMLLAGTPLDAKRYTLTTADTEFYSLYLDYNAAIPAGITAYTGQLSADETKLTVQPVAGSVLPAGTAVLVKSAAPGTFAFESTTATAAVGENSLKGVAADTDLTVLAETGKQVLTLGMKDGQIGFRQPADTKIKANRAYLLVSETSPAKVSIMMADPTGISEIGNDSTDGAPACYNLAGQRVEAKAKGLIIKNGKKHIAK